MVRHPFICAACTPEFRLRHVKATPFGIRHHFTFPFTFLASLPFQIITLPFHTALNIQEVRTCALPYIHLYTNEPAVVYSHPAEGIWHMSDKSLPTTASHPQRYTAQSPLRNWSTLWTCRKACPKYIVARIWILEEDLTRSHSMSH